MFISSSNQAMYRWHQPPMFLLSRYGFVELGSLVNSKPWTSSLRIKGFSLLRTSFFLGNFSCCKTLLQIEYIRYPLNPTTNQPVFAYIYIVPALPKQLYMCSPLKLGPFTHTHTHQPTTAILLRSPGKWLRGVVSFESSFPTTNPKSQKLGVEFNSWQIFWRNSPFQGKVGFSLKFEKICITVSTITKRRSPTSRGFQWCIMEFLHFFTNFILGGWIWSVIIHPAEKSYLKSLTPNFAKMLLDLAASRWIHDSHASRGGGERLSLH